MAYIYQITNDINGKIYIGKTEFSLEKRFKEHCQDAFREKCEKRPLYAAMRKYGIEHFHIELIEETDIPEEREKYWIEEKQSFKFGNATKIVYQIDKNTKEVIAEYPSVTTAAKETGSTASGISLVCNGKRKTHNNYIWAYKIN